MTTSRAVQEIEQMAPQLAALSRELWEHPEVAFTERYTSRRLMSILREEGFAVDNPVAGLETGFVARWGHGKPCIAILAEFDALPGFSQKTQTTEEPEVPGGAGHACGHNLMGAAHTGAAIAVKRELEARGMEGTVVLYGCPAEEVLTGKVFMARAGLFDGCDCAINFHPDSVNGVDMHVLAGIDNIKFNFHGTISHAAARPYDGRSASDAAELMNVGANYLREHMIDEARIHYAILDSGGISPNVVQPHASVLYLIRAPRTEQAQELYRRVNLIAQGMAMATETTVHWELIKTCAELIPNLPLEQQLEQSFREVPAPEVTAEEMDFLRSITASSTSPKSEQLQKALDRLEQPENRAAVEARLDEDFHGQPLPYEPKLVPPIECGSTDVGDVSWQCPTAQIHTATWAPSSGGHSWQIVAQGKGTVAHKYMCYCGKILGQTAIRLLQQPQTLLKARAAYEKELQGRSYVPIPPQVKPRAISSL